MLRVLPLLSHYVLVDNHYTKVSAVKEPDVGVVASVVVVDERSDDDADLTERKGRRERAERRSDVSRLSEVPLLVEAAKIPLRRS